VTADGPEERRRQLVAMQRRATGLLGLIAIAFVVVAHFGGVRASAAGGGAAWLPYAIAGLEGSLVGGLADWFAVTALFRHPLGLPIPHTAIIRERKDQFGATLGAFVQENFLSSSVLSERIRAARLGDRVAAWLQVPSNAERSAGYLTEALSGLVDVLDDDAVHRVIDDAVRAGIEAAPVAAWAGRALRIATVDGRHQEVLTAVLGGVRSMLEEHREDLRTRFAMETPWWLPGPLEHRVFDRLIDGTRDLLEAIARDPEHELRRGFHDRMQILADRLEHDPALAARGEEIKHELLAHPDLRAWSASIWADAKTAVREQAADASSPMRVRLAGVVRAAGERLGSDIELRGRIDSVAERAARYVAEHHHREISDLIAVTVSRWDAEETSDKLELLLGRDLQFIRINGTVVGGLAGLAIHALATAL